MKAIVKELIYYVKELESPIGIWQNHIDMLRSTVGVDGYTIDLIENICSEIRRLDPEIYFATKFPRKDVK